MNSGTHLKAAKATQKNKLFGYFSPQALGLARTLPSSSDNHPILAASKASSSNLSAAPWAHDKVIINIDGGHRAKYVKTPSDIIRNASNGNKYTAPPSLIERIRNATARLSVSIPLATEHDELARFSDAVPSLKASEYEEPWEMVDKALNPLIGYDRSVPSLAGIIRRGRLGMDGLCNWLEGCVVELGIDPALLEGKIERLLAAFDLM